MPQGTGRRFMQETRYEYLDVSDQSKKLPQPPLELNYDRGLPAFDLPAPEQLLEFRLDLKATIENRRSVRQYTEEALTLEELSFLLWCTQGVKEKIDDYATLRTVPSAGARHAFETYLLVNRVDKLESGLYRYLAIDHRLVQLEKTDGLADKLAEACWGQTQVRRGAVTFFWAAVPYRMAWRYGERGYRYLHLDAGHVCQNLYLSAEAIGAGVCAIAAFQDDVLNGLLDLDGEEQFIIYLAAVGKKPEQNSQ
jgi:SagB-type dehydrogenase family enzyme